MLKYEAVVVGVSAGGLKALSELLVWLPAGYPLPVLIVQHVLEGSDGYLAELLNERAAVRVKEADDKEPIRPGWVYLAPAGYHLLVEEERTLGLSVDPRVNYSRPSIDVLFESAARVYKHRCAGVILTGANSDGSAGLRMIKQRGGLALVQDPASAEYDAMPKAAIRAVQADYIMELADIGRFLSRLGQAEGEGEL